MPPHFGDGSSSTAGARCACGASPVSRSASGKPVRHPRSMKLPVRRPGGNPLGDLLVQVVSDPSELGSLHEQESQPRILRCGAQGNDLGLTDQCSVLGRQPSQLPLFICHCVPHSQVKKLSGDVRGFGLRCAGPDGSQLAAPLLAGLFPWRTSPQVHHLAQHLGLCGGDLPSCSAPRLLTRAARRSVGSREPHAHERIFFQPGIGHAGPLGAGPHWQ